MSGLDLAARGLAIRAGADAARRSQVLMAAGPSGPVYGAAGAAFVTVHSVTLAPDAIPGGAMLRFRMLLAKYAPFNGGHNWRLRIGDVVVAQNSIGASLATFDTEQVIAIAHDRKSAFTYALNSLDQPSVAAGRFGTTGAKNGSIALLGARQPSNGIMFVEYSAPPTVETVRVDFRQPVTIAIDVRPINGDTLEVLGASIEMLSGAAGTVDYTHPKAVSGLPMDWVAQLRRQRAGWPVAAKGLGGQRSEAIADRLLADPIAGRRWNAVLWMGYNDFNNNVGNPTGWWNAVKTQVDRVLAYRTNPRTIVCNFHPNTSWTVGDANYQAMQFVNAQMAATYGNRVCDLFTALATDAGKVPAASMADNVHLANPGYTTVMQAVDAKITALGW